MTTAATSTDTVLIVGIGSGIGAQLAEHYLANGKHVIGTSRNGIGGFALDIDDPLAIAKFRDDLVTTRTRWNLLVVSVGLLTPIAPLLEVDFADWESSFRVNCIAQWRLVQALHPLRGDDPSVIFFAGGAVNGVLANYSSYGVAKIALIKMVEYLDHEDPTTRYAIIGPGTLPTNIHRQTLAAGDRAGDNLERTKAFLAIDGDAGYGEVARCIDWIRTQPRKTIGGRNISVVHDPWGERPGAQTLIHSLTENPDFYKLRRAEGAAAPAEALVAEILAALPSVPQQLAHSAPLYAALRDALKPAIRSMFSDGGTSREFGPFGRVSLPYLKMGAVDSCDLFGLDELIIFAFYWANRERYERVADVGANIGLHSIVLARCGFDVRAFEPDPRHADILQRNLARNDIESVELRRAAVSNRNGQAEFVRVLGNTTSSHIAGSKNPYGELERFPICVEDIRDVLDWADLIKIDAEGHEATIFRAVEPDGWRNCDVMVEIGTPDNAQEVFDHFEGSSMSLFSQKRGWRRVERAADMPASYREGSLFVTSGAEMLWQSSSKCA